MNKGFWIKKIIGFTLLAILGVAALGYVLMLLWNNVLTTVVNVPLIGFWQAIGLFVLSKLLFGGFKGGCGGHRGRHWKQGMKEKWNQMSPEERAQFKEEWRNRCRMWGKQEKDHFGGAE